MCLGYIWNMFILLTPDFWMLFGLLETLFIVIGQGQFDIQFLAKAGICHVMNQREVLVPSKPKPNLSSLLFRCNDVLRHQP